MMADCAGPRAVECHTGRVPMNQPKPAAIFDHCQHCGVITVWQYRVDNQDAGAEGGDYRCQDCQCCGQSADEVAERLAQTLANLDDHEPYPTSDS